MWVQITIALIATVCVWWYRSHKDDKLDTLQRKKVLVTGASEGVGEHLAYHYARLGARVAVTARRLEKLNQVLEKCKTLGSAGHQNHFAMVGDMASLDDTKKVIQQAVKRLGGLDILVLNHAKVEKKGPFKSQEEHLKQLHLMMDTNFRANVHLTSHALPQLIASEGSIIVVNCALGKVPQPFYAAYSASKCALNGFFHSLRNQFVLLKQNVSVTSCTLGLVGTESVKNRLDDQEREFLFSRVTPESPEDTALKIVTGGAQRKHDLYIPHSTRLMTIMYSIWPSLVDYLSRQLIPPKEW